MRASAGCYYTEVMNNIASAATTEPAPSAPRRATVSTSTSVKGPTSPLVARKTAAL